MSECVCIIKEQNVATEINSIKKKSSNIEINAIQIRER